jgi:hypothetical protein
MGSDAQLQQLLAEYGLDTGNEDPQEYVNRLLEEYGFAREQPDQGLDIFQPVRTFFGATGNVGGQLLGLVDPQAYEEASKELLGDFGYDATSPWYEKAEALPGLGDVAAAMVPDEVRDSAVGRAVGPFGRIVGNIIGDPTTYTPYILSKLGGVIARSVPAAAPLVKEFSLARQARQAKVAAGVLSQAEALGADSAEAARIYDIVKNQGTAAKRLGFEAAEALRTGGDMAMGTAAALAYGPQVIKSAWEGAKAIPEADTPGEAVITGVNTALMAGLAALMGKGLIDAGTAARTLAADATGKPLEAIKEQVGEGVAEREARVLAQAQELGPPPVVSAEELKGLNLEAARRRLEEGSRVEPEAEPPIEIRPSEEPPAPAPARRPEPPQGPEAPEGAAVEPPVEPEVRAPETALQEPVEGPRTPQEPTPEVKAPGEPVEVPTEPPSEPSVQRAEPTPTEETPPITEAPAAGPEDVLRQQLEKVDDELAKEGTIQKAVRSIVEGRKSRGEEGPTDPILAAEMKVVLDDEAARRKLLDAKFDNGAGKKVPLTELPGNKVYPAIVGWMKRNRLKEGGAGDVARGEAGAAERRAGGIVSETMKEGAAVGEAGAPTAKGKKALGRKEQPGAFEAANEILKRRGLRYKEFAEIIEPDFTRALKLPHNIETFKHYVDLREEGVSRAEAITRIAKAQKRGNQSIRNLIKDYEKKINDEALARHGEEVRAAAEAEGTLEAPAEAPTARTATRTDVTGLHNKWSRLKSRIPSKPNGMDAEGFANVLKAKKADLQRMLEDYYRFTDDRSQVKGLGRKFPDTELKSLAKSLGVKVPKGVNVHWVVRKIGEKLGIPDTHWSPILDSHRVKRAAGATRAGAFDLPGWKAQRGGKGAAGEWVGPQKTKVSVVEDGKQMVVDEIDNPAAAKVDIVDALDNPKIETVMIPDRVKGLGPIIKELPLVLDDAWMDAHPDSPMVRYRVDRGEGVVSPFEARDTANPYDPHEGLPMSLESIRGEVDQAVGQPPSDIRVGLRRQLSEKGATGLSGQGRLGTKIGSGSFHSVYRLDGVKTKDGRNVVMRVGNMPWIPNPTKEQRALMMPVLGHGKLLSESKAWNRPVFYTLHPEGFRMGSDVHALMAAHDGEGKFYDLMRKLGLTEEEGQGPSQYYDPADHADLHLRLKIENKLPEGVSLQDWFNDHAELYSKAIDNDLDVVDIGGHGFVRTNQTAYLKLGKNEVVPEGTVVRQTGDDRWGLYLIDPGVASPNTWESLGTQWEGLDRSQRLALWNEGESGKRLPLDTQQQRAIHYQEDDIMSGLDVGEDMKVVNHDRRATDDYVRRLAETGTETARALKKVTDDIVGVVNQEFKDIGMDPSDLLDVRFRGLTASPHLGGVYHPRIQGFGPAIYLHPIEQVKRAGSRAEAIDNMLYVLLHEITHNKETGHGKSFRNFESYIKGLRKIQAQMDSYRKTLGDAFTEVDYRAMRDELVPEFNAMRDKYGRPSWRKEALAELPPRTAEGRAETGTNRRGRGQADLEGGGARGVQPSGAVPRGGRVPPGELRSATAAGRSAAAGRAEGEGARYSGGRGAYEETVERVENILGKDNPKIDAEKAKTLLSELTARKQNVQPRDLHNTAWGLSVKFVNQMTDGQVADYLKGRKPSGPKDAVWNLAHFKDLSDRQRARMLFFGDITSGHRKRDRPRPWHEVEPEVQDMLGLDTPEKWALAFRRKGGGLRDAEVLLLREIHNELAGRVFDAEQQMHNIFASGEAEHIETAMLNYNNAKAAYFGVADRAADLLTEQARGLAIARKAIRRQSPGLAFQQDLLSALRERMRTKFKDQNEAEKYARLLRDVFNNATERAATDPDSWAEFHRAYRMIMGTGLKDKAIEFYKAGLLGYSSRMANITSNTLFRGVRFIEDGVAAALDAVGSKLTGKERDVFLGEAGVSTLAMRRAFTEALPKWLKDNADAFMLRPEDVGEALKKGGIMEDLLQHPGAIEGKFGEFVRFAFKGLTADDQFAKHISAMDHMYRQIYRRLRKGEYPRLKGESYVQATERIFGDLRSNFQDATQGLPYDQTKFGAYEKLFKAANEVAREDTFQKELGNLGRGVQSVLHDHPMLQILVPFLRTPTNIAKETIKRTPLGLIEVAAKWKDLDAAQRVQALSRPITGTAIGLGVLSYAMDGTISGGGPIDPEDREALVASGWQPYSVKVGNQWVSFQRFEPIAAIFGIAADAADGLRNGDFDKWNTGVMRVMQSTAENITNKTFLAGLDGVTSAISHPNLFLPRFMKQMQGSMVPNSLGFVPVAHLARAIDPVYRDAQPFTLDVWKRKIPFLSTTVDPQYGPTGEERKRGGTALERLASPFSRWPTREGPEALGAEEIVRLGVAPSPPRRYTYSKGGEKVELTREEKQAFAMAMREATKTIGQRILKDPNYLRLPDDEEDPRWQYGQRTKKDVLQRLFSKYRARVRDRMRRGIESRARQQYRERQRSQPVEQQIGIR